ncbi:hypothetical protein CYMTET_38375 [Cymbomonas tetramitiformis]|uniref:Uncharacterized protein n=1 Tax=Cymbomonas tetramitiformis TaxID=36881 RepID=A0AAE0CC77_9CHLO|nr:hypothetical protein CYMTET_38375 [Cymbomonas tetramitiformis]
MTITIDDANAMIAHHLATNGYAVVRLFEHVESEGLCDAFKQALRELPEYRSCSGWRYSKTGFGALGVASSFHNRFVRRMRLVAHARVLPVLREVDRLGDARASVGPIRCERFSDRFAGYRRKNKAEAPRKVHQMLDRMLVRTKDQKPSPESWHQDVSVYEDGDTVYGGWIAFTDQTIRLVPATQHLHTPIAGFAKISAAALQDLLPRALDVSIPRGCLLLMNQSIVHEVLANPITTDPMCRLFTGWRLTHDHRTLLEATDRNRNCRQDGCGSAQSIDAVLDDMAVPKLPSNQLPSMYNLRNVDYIIQRQGLREWCDAYLQNAMLVVTPTYVDGVTAKRPEGMEPTRVWKVPDLHAPSIAKLRQLSSDGFDRPVDWDALFPPYTAEEREMYKPHSPLNERAIVFASLADSL